MVSETHALLPTLPLDELTPSRLWSHLPPALRLLAARALYAHDWGDAPTRREADVAIARALRARETAIRKMPHEKRVDYLARAVRPSDSLASSLLTALHLEQRRPLLSAFLDGLEIPHTDGLIHDDHDLAAPRGESLRRAVEALFRAHPHDEVETYLATLLALDPENWAGLQPLLAERGTA